MTYSKQHQPTVSHKSTHVVPCGDVSNATVESAERFLARADLGPRGKMLGISKMFQDRDVSALKTKKTVVAVRPRGVLSGFLAILPSLRTAMYIPPAGSRQSASIVRLRLSEAVWQEGAILSCYWEEGVLVLEDMLARGDVRLWSTRSFAQRWGEDMQEFCHNWMPDPTLAGCEIRLADYMSLEQLDFSTLQQNQVLEFIWAEDVGMRRFIWVPDRHDIAQVGSTATETGGVVDGGVQTWLARREAHVGPDIFSLWSENGERQTHLALVRTLAVSRMLREYKGDEIPVYSTWNKMFERHEIVSISSPVSEAPSVKNPDLHQLISMLKRLNQSTDSATTRTLKEDIGSAAEKVLIDANGQTHGPYIRELREHGFDVFPVERDRFGWLVGGIQTDKGVVTFG